MVNKPLINGGQDIKSETVKDNEYLFIISRPHPSPNIKIGYGIITILALANLFELKLLRQKLLCRLPKIYLVTFRINNVGKAAVVVLLDISNNSDSFLAQFRKERAQIGNSQVEHKFLCTRVELGRVFFFDREHRTAGSGKFHVAVAKGDTQVLLVPRHEFLRIVSLKEHAADASYFLHGGECSICKTP